MNRQSYENSSLRHSILPVLFSKSSNGFAESSAANKQNSEEEIKHICGLGASVGYERVERVFNTPRLKSQICFISSSVLVSFVSPADPTNQDLFSASHFGVFLIVVKKSIILFFQCLYHMVGIFIIWCWNSKRFPHSY